MYVRFSTTSGTFVSTVLKKDTSWVFSEPPAGWERRNARSMRKGKGSNAMGSFHGSIETHTCMCTCGLPIMPKSPQALLVAFLGLSWVLSSI